MKNAGTSAAETALCSILLSAMFATHAAAQMHALKNEAGTAIIIWRDEKALHEGMAMFRAGMNRTNPGLVMPLITCVADIGTPIVVTDRGFMTSEVVVASGPHTGCKGLIVSEEISKEEVSAPLPIVQPSVSQSARVDTRSSTDGAYLQGLSSLDRGDFDRAIADFTKAIQQDSSDVFPYLKRAVAHEKRGDRNEAIADYRQALAVNRRAIEPDEYLNQQINAGLKRLTAAKR
jgi:tetratricopeptide (TPR) repeat protein